MSKLRVTLQLAAFTALMLLWGYTAVDFRKVDADFDATLKGSAEYDFELPETPWLPDYCAGEFRGFICQDKYKWDWKTMVAIMIGESRESPTAWNGSEPNGTESYGLLQINSAHGYNPMLLDDPEWNVEVGYGIWLEQGYEAWGAYTDGKWWPIYLSL